MSDIMDESLLDMFIFETMQLIEQLEQLIIKSEQNDIALPIDEFFRIMHTIKGSASMMLYSDIANVAHSLEDLFQYFRQNKVEKKYVIETFDILLESVDFIKHEIEKVKSGEEELADASLLISQIKRKLQYIQTQPEEDEHVDLEVYYRASVFFEEGCEMENIRAYAIIHNLSDIAKDIKSIPENLIEDSVESIEIIKKNGIQIFFKTECSIEELKAFFEQIIFLKEYSVELLPEGTPYEGFNDAQNQNNNDAKNLNIKAQNPKNIDAQNLNINDQNQNNINAQNLNNINAQNPNNINFENVGNIDARNNDMSFYIGMNTPQNDTADIKKDELDVELKKSNNNVSEALNNQLYMTKILNKKDNGENTFTNQGQISVSLTKVDMLMDLMGELVTSSAMVTQEYFGSQQDNRDNQNSLRQLSKITRELQDIVMSIRMVPLSHTFQKMNRIVRDMSKKLNKDVELEIIGEETEVDKNIIEHISDPIMHLIRNSIDHGIEHLEDRKRKGKPDNGRITLEGKSAGGDVWIIVKDDGRGLDKEKIMKKAREKKLLITSESSLSDREIYSLIFSPGFSTKDNVTEFSGRGVGLDVVSKNIEDIKGTVFIDSQYDVGTVVSIKIPLTLAIIDGITICVGEQKFTIPKIVIQESFRVSEREVIVDPEGSEIVMLRGICLPLIRLNKLYNIDTSIKNLSEGIIIVIDNGDKKACIFTDRILGEQQVVVKTLPKYLNVNNGLAGCTILGDGSISLIVDVEVLLKNILNG